MVSVCSVCGGDLRLDRETFDEADRVYVGFLNCVDCHRSYIDTRKPQERMGASMAKRKRASKVDRKLTKPDKPRKARQPTLPGTEAVRDEKLDALCEGIGDEREKINAAKVEEAELIASALERMQKKTITVYRHAKVELARVPGAEKLRVRITKEEGDAGEENLETTNDDETGDDDETRAVYP